MGIYIRYDTHIRRNDMQQDIMVKKLKDNLYLFDERREATGYLLIGEEKACVIDTMNGYGNLAEVVRSITDKPIVVVNTHGHPDHIYGNIYFDNAYMNYKDLELADGFIADSEFVKMCQEKNLSMPEFTNIEEGDVIDLGGITLKVYALPGHTAGGIILLCPEERILFTGDSINHHLWLQLKECMPVEEYISYYERIMFLEKEADVILHGHAVDYDDISLMGAMLQGLKDIVAGKTDEDIPYKWFDGVDVQHPFEVDKTGTFERPDSVICYSKKNIYK